MRKLTDIQRVTLSKAAQRDDGCATAPASMDRAAITKLAASFVSRKLMREIRSKGGMPVWRKDKDGRSISLVITRAGRNAIGVAGDHEQAQNVVGAARGSAKASIKRPGEQAVPKARSASAGIDAKGPGLAEPRRCAEPPRPSSKKAHMIELLSQKDGATVEALGASAGWLPHTARAFLTGLRKQGYSIERRRADGSSASTYHIIGAAGVGG